MKKIKTIAIAGLLATLGPAAFAQSYVGVGIGSAHSCFDYDVAGDCTGAAAAGKVILGYALPGTDFAIESTYTHMGTFTGHSSVNSARIKIDTIGAGGAWRPQFGAGWGGVVRGGIEWGKVRSEFSSTPDGVSNPAIHLSDSTGYWQPYAGVGATYAITPNVRLEADLDVTRVKLSHSPQTVHAFMLGATFAF